MKLIVRAIQRPNSHKKLRLYLHGNRKLAKYFVTDYGC